MTALEVCLDDIEGAVIAERHGADRIELCASLDDGGITPSIGTVATVLQKVEQVGVQVIVRQRGGDFVYSEVEIEAMCADIEAIRAIDPAPAVEVGFVLGALRADGTIDEPATARLLRACAGASVTFHKAFDLTPDLRRSLETVVDLGIERILTSGGRQRATDGVDSLADLTHRADGRVTILAGGGIRPNDVAETVARTGVTEVHFRAAARRPSESSGGVNAYDSGSRMTTSAELVDEMVLALRGAHS